MTIDEINTIRLALDTPEHNRHYVKHVTDAKTILNKEEAAINYTHCCESDSELLFDFLEWFDKYCTVDVKPNKEDVELYLSK